MSVTPAAETLSESLLKSSQFPLAPAGKGMENGDDHGDAVRSNGNAVIVARNGSLVFRIEHDSTGEIVFIRVNIQMLRQSSDYFKTLLDPQKFQEGTTVHRSLQNLDQGYLNWTEVPFDDLPKININDVGPTSSVKSIQPLLKDFFRIVHGFSIDLGPRKLPLTNLANIAIVGDRFGTTAALENWARKNGYLSRAQDARFVESHARQRLMIATLWQHSPWSHSSSKQLIVSGSKLWRGQRPESSALWWDLPRGVEEELQYRRAFVLETINSLQEHLLAQYSSKQRQCKLGYDTSPECDSFQLGEFVRFLVKTGALQLRSIVSEGEATGFYTGDIQDLIDKLRSYPSYQLDSHHTHCGPKKQFVLGLSLIENYLQEDHLGICSSCWNSSITNEAWSEVKRPLNWSYKFHRDAIMRKKSVRQNYGCPKHDTSCRDLFIATNRDWSSD